MLAHSAITGRGAEDIARSVEDQVRSGRIAPGARLPTVRALARSLGVSPATVAAAYDRVRKRGIVQGRGRLGTSVSPRPPVALPRADVVAAPGLRDLAEGSPDPELLPPFRTASGRFPARSQLYGGPAELPALVARARRAFDEDGVPNGNLAVVGGAMDGIERVLQAHLRPGDRVVVEDPGYPAVFDLLGALGLVLEPVGLDDSGLLPRPLAAALARGARACVLTPRAQNPTGAALDPPRARALREVFDAHPDALVIEDDHAGPVAGSRATTTAHPRRQRFAVIRSVSKWLGPDLRLALLAGDAVTVARVQGRQAVGSGWVSHLLQGLVADLWSDPQRSGRLLAAERVYAERRTALLEALAAAGIAAQGRSGFNVWIKVAEEAAVLTAMAARGWALRAGERYRIQSPPAVRITAATLRPADARRLARDLAGILRPVRRIVSG